MLRVHSASSSSLHSYRHSNGGVQRQSFYLVPWLLMLLPPWVTNEISTLVTDMKSAIFLQFFASANLFHLHEHGLRLISVVFRARAGGSLPCPNVSNPSFTHLARENE
eukprot:s4418_g7.t1